jgi:hypothetical protein
MRHHEVEKIRRVRSRTKRGSAILFILSMVLATAFVVSVAATFGRASNDNEYRAERDYKAARTWDAAVSMADAKSAAGAYTSLPATFAISLNGFSGTMTVANNGTSMANSLKLTSTLTAPDGAKYAESAIIASTSGYLTGEYWWTNGASITANAGAFSWMMSNPTPTGTFAASVFNYNGADTALMQTWLSGDGASFSGTNDNLEDGIVELYGYVTIPNTTTTLQLQDDDGASMSLDGDNWTVTNDGAHSESAVTLKVTTAGTYPIFIEYFNHEYGGGSGTGNLQLQWDTTGLGVYTAIPTADLRPLSQSWAFNGTAASYGNGTELVNGGTNQAGSAWLSAAQKLTTFHAAFDFQIANPVADGFTFCIQNSSTTALGSSGSGLGYAGIKNSVALKFDIYNDAGEGTNSIGVFTGGASPTTPATTLSNISLTSGDLMHCSLAYSGSTLSITITDLVTGKAYTGSLSMNVASAIGGTTGYVGFTASTATSTSKVYILNFNFGS